MTDHADAFFVPPSSSDVQLGRLGTDPTVLLRHLEPAECLAFHIRDLQLDAIVGCAQRTIFSCNQSGEVIVLSFRLEAVIHDEGIVRVLVKFTAEVYRQRILSALAQVVGARFGVEVKDEYIAPVAYVAEGIGQLR